MKLVNTKRQDWTQAGDRTQIVVTRAEHSVLASNPI